MSHQWRADKLRNYESFFAEGGGFGQVRGRQHRWQGLHRAVRLLELGHPSLAQGNGQQGRSLSEDGTGWIPQAPPRRRPPSQRCQRGRAKSTACRAPQSERPDRKFFWSPDSLPVSRSRAHHAGLRRRFPRAQLERTMVFKTSTCWACFKRV